VEPTKAFTEAGCTEMETGTGGGGVFVPDPEPPHAMQNPIAADKQRTPVALKDMKSPM
jgi:hypothetical protein